MKLTTFLYTSEVLVAAFMLIVISLAIIVICALLKDSYDKWKTRPQDRPDNYVPMNLYGNWFIGRKRNDGTIKAVSNFYSFDSKEEAEEAIQYLIQGFYLEDVLDAKRSLNK